MSVLTQMKYLSNLIVTDSFIVNPRPTCRPLGGAAMGGKANWQMGKCDRQLASCTGAKTHGPSWNKLAIFQVKLELDRCQLELAATLPLIIQMVSPAPISYSSCMSLLEEDYILASRTELDLSRLANRV